MRRIQKALPLVVIALLLGIIAFMLYYLVAVAPNNRAQEQRAEIVDITARVARLTQEVQRLPWRQRDEYIKHLLAQALLEAHDTFGPLIIQPEKGPMLSVEENKRSGEIILEFLE